MGEVYRARDTRLGREVAVKVLPPAFSADPDRLRRFEQEARAASALNHPNILTVHDIGSREESPYVVSELLEGETLRERLAGGAIPARKATDVAIQVAEGLAAAHEKGIVHRDLKPENLFVTKDGRVKILDFGLAKLTRPEAPSDSRTEAPTSPGETEPGVVMGTVGYMSPEQVRGEAADHRSDIFALGAVFYEMLAGRRPFRGDSHVEAMHAILKEDPPDLSRVQPELPPGLEPIVRRCLEKSPDERFQSARDLAFALKMLSSASVSAAAPPPTSRSSRRIWWGLAAAAGLAAAVLLLLGRREPGPSAGGEAAARPVPLSTRKTADLAILPLKVLTPAEEINHLSVGIPDAIITRLANVRALRLRPTASVLRYEKAAVDPQKAGEELAVENVVSGTVQKAGNSYRIAFQLVRTRDGVPLWGENFDVAAKELLGLQDTVARRVTNALQVRMSAAEQERVYQRYTRNTEAYELYLQGRALMANYTDERMRSAIESYERALRLDPEYALARAGLAAALAYFSVRFAYESEAEKWGRKSDEEARRALRQDPNLAEAHFALASAAGTLYRNFDWPLAIAETQKALELNPNLDLAYGALARAFYHLGLLEQSKANARRAAEIVPGPNIEADRILFMMAFYGGRFAEAKRMGESLLPRTDAPAIPLHLGLAYYYLGEAGRAVEILGAVRRKGRPDTRAQAALASVLAATGERQKAEELVRSFLAGSYRDHHVAYSIGAAYAHLGPPEEALRWLRESARTGFPCYPWFAQDPLLDPLRGEPEFKAFLDDLRRSHEAAKARYGAPAG